MMKKKSLMSAAVMGMGVVAFLSVGCEQVSGPSQDNNAARQKANAENPSKGGAGVTVEKPGGGAVAVSDSVVVVTDGSITLTEVSGAPKGKGCTGPDSLGIGGSDTLVVSGDDVVKVVDSTGVTVHPTPGGDGVVQIDSTSVAVHPTPIDPSHVRPMPQP